MITSIHSKANSTDVNGYAKRFTDLIDKSEIEDKVIVDVNTELKKDNENLTIALNKKLSEDRPSDGFEKLRDRGLICFFKTIVGATYSLNDEIAEAAKKIYEVIKRHDTTMYDLPQDQQTSKMASMFKEFEAPDMVAALDLTSTTILVDETKEVNQKYLDARALESKEESEKEDPVLVTENAKKVRVGTRKIMNYLDTVTSVVSNQTMIDLNNGLIDIIESANRVIKSRTTRKDNTKEK